ncbi:hypothetical protein [Beijerinckia sp. L45]|uniref:hypothetical protein n=1 Tax=Beijerinckia sp. L45 TaxID=1641855 RepID=UPI00131E66AE|nr:hypothetical protein [Beijerinckia sp. L45]
MIFLAASAGFDAATAGSGTQTDKPDGADAGDEDDDDDRKVRQPVRVGDLIGRDVIAPVESQDLLGHVTKVVQTGDGPTFVMTYGGHFGFGTHLVCVPADTLALTGYAIQAKGISPDELGKLPDCDGASGKPLDASAMIEMKLAKPAH